MTEEDFVSGADLLPTLELVRECELLSPSGSAWSEHKNLSEKATLQMLERRTQLVLKGALQLRGKLDDMSVVALMLRRYPWRGRGISKSKHAELSWFQFCCLCYEFREKLKQYFEVQKTFNICIGEEQSNWLKGELKNLDKVLKKFFVYRNMRTHRWAEWHEYIDAFSAIELLAAQGEEPYASIVNDHHSDLKLILSIEVGAAIAECRHVYGRVTHAGAGKTMIEVDKYHKIYQGIKSDSVRISLLGTISSINKDQP